MLAGLVGTIVPLLPGLPLIWAAALVVFLLEGMTGTRIAVLVLLAVLAAAGMAGQVALPARLGVVGEVDRGSLAVGLAGGVVGFFVIPVVGFPVGALLGVAAAEWRRLGAWGPARARTLRVARSYGVGVAVELAAGLVMVAVFLAGVWWT